jgi:hypothetical protein
MMGCRGLPAGLTLNRLISRQRGISRAARLKPLTEARVLKWADAHRGRTGSWPNSRSGPIADAPGETWQAVDHALRKKQRGLTAGISLVQLLVRERGVRTRQYATALTETQILAWARAHRQRTGAWPNFRSGPIPEAPGETWRAVDMALRGGYRNLAGGSSLARLLAERRGVRNRTSLPILRPKQIVAWAKAHHQRTRTWPHSESGPIADAPGETWKGVDMALRGGYRGLPGGSSLRRLLHRYRKAAKKAKAGPGRE